MVITLSLRKWITIKPAIWITFIPAKMHKNQPVITVSHLSAASSRFIHCNVFPDSFPAWAGSPCYLAYTHSLFLH